MSQDVTKMFGGIAGTGVSVWKFGIFCLGAGVFDERRRLGGRHAEGLGPPGKDLSRQGERNDDARGPRAAGKSSSRANPRRSAVRRGARTGGKLLGRSGGGCTVGRRWVV